MTCYEWIKIIMIAIACGIIWYGVWEMRGK